ncbi:MAG: Hsp33 family molecular chaperone HslO [Rhodocyclaceae bacterium]|jgi:molecular chaperone Hsp33|nr:Hsp33 family molecular chaperone HslO [Rhodocyclaceae bacterium]
MDYVRRFLFEQLDIRGAIVALGNAWHEMHAGRDDPPAVTALLGELAVVTALIAGNLKTPGRLTFQLQGHGLVSLLLVDCDEQLRLRGTARLRTDAAVPPAPTFHELLGDGQLVLTLQTGFGDPYQSIVPLTGDSLTEVFEHYLVQSEQQPARLFLTATDDFAGGLFLQKLPDADARDPDGWNRIGHLAATLRPAELAEPAGGLLMRLFPEEDIRLFDPRPVRYHCPRDEEKVLAMLKSLGRDELVAALAEQGEIAVEDDICRQHYRYGPDILPRLFD